MVIVQCLALSLATGTLQSINPNLFSQSKEVDQTTLSTLIAVASDSQLPLLDKTIIAVDN
jgi:hypothetical protein